MSSLFTAYRWLAFVVGVLLAFGAFVAAPLKYLTTEGSDLHGFGEQASLVWVVHGWIFMVYVVVAFLLSRRARWSVQFTLLALVAGWSVGFTIVALVAGLVPLLIFWVERRVAERFRAEHPELA